MSKKVINGAIWAFFLFLKLSTAFHFYVNDHRRKENFCLKEDLQENAIYNAKIKVSSQMEDDSGHSNILIYVLDENGNKIKSRYLKKEDRFVFMSRADGVYNLCFQTGNNGPQIKTKISIESGIDDKYNSIDFAKFEKMGAIEIEMKKMIDLMVEIKQELIIQNIRESQMTKMTDETSELIKNISMLETFLFVVFSVAQMYVLKHFFKLKKLI
ncbi:Transmembrane emp24 domain-containing protein 10 [Bonamia ostreae]|uniref:Transmembrane emp24 domain-containing protein 10 n=1 Tax=Bonamia ostreae TaxID=126728 RepID=A0ABV2AL21_9EUKA